ncbi:MAG: TraB/GumN family protein, partial [Bacilli bacterium]
VYTDAAGIEMLNNIQTSDQILKEFETLIKAYKSNEIQNAVQGQIESSALAKKYMLDYRNNRWVRQMDKQLASGDTHFIAVGAAHLFGDTGILTQMQNRGYKVEWIDTTK